jgi:mevalonate kinase
MLKKNQFVKYTDACVESFLGGDMKALFMNTKKLSSVVLNNFKPMIPNNFMPYGKMELILTIIT